MKIKFKNSFLKAIQKIEDPKLKLKIASAIREVESVHGCRAIVSRGNIEIDHTIQSCGS